MVKWCDKIPYSILFAVKTQIYFISSNFSTFNFNYFTGSLHRHLQNHGVDYLQFSFRWMNNLLTRELPLHCTIRLWDTYLAESDDFAVFHLYVCAAFLISWREQILQQNDFQVKLKIWIKMFVWWCGCQLNLCPRYSYY